MKNILIILFTVMQSTAFCQGLDGKLQIGGNASFYFNQRQNEDPDNSFVGENNYRQQGVSVFPQVGYFIKENVSVGGRIGYSRSIFDQQIINASRVTVLDSESTSSIFRIGPFVRYHIPVTEQFYFFAQANVEAGFGNTKRTNDENTIEEDVFTFEAGIRPGILFFLTEKVGIEGSFGFLGYHMNNANLNPEPVTITREFGFEMSSFLIGLQFYL